MSYNISSEHFSNPMLKELLLTLAEFFDSAGAGFFVIGATARDIILSDIHKQSAGRKTDDLDIAIAIPDWNMYQNIAEQLCLKEEFSKSKDQKQRFLYKNVYKLDIIPFGGLAKADHFIYWPPDESFVMPVRGFTEVVKDVIEVSIDDEFTIRVASLPGIYILKLYAWNDRHTLNNRDADDMALIIANYLTINDERAAKEHYDLYEKSPFSIFVAGATLLARDVKVLASEDIQVLDKLFQILLDETKQELDSHLINQMLESHPSLKYEEVYDAMLSITNELRK